jgi:hypothetical protein
VDPAVRQRRIGKSVEEIVRELKQMGKTSSNDYREQLLRIHGYPQKQASQ